MKDELTIFDKDKQVSGIWGKGDSHSGMTSNFP
jgi:hypothetical protein